MAAPPPAAASLSVALPSEMLNILHDTLSSSSSTSHTSPSDLLTSNAFATALDAADSLSKFREAFHIPPIRSTPTWGMRSKGAACIYLCGNSLGLQPKSARAAVERELLKWERYGIDGQFVGEEPWVRVNELCVENMSELVGAKPVEVCLMNTLTVNLHMMMISFYRPNATRNKVLIEHKAFPSDHHAVVSQIKEKGFDPAECLIEVQPRAGEETLKTEDIVAKIRQYKDSLALVLLSAVQYYTGQAFEIQPIAEALRKYAPQCRLGLDLAHAVGNTRVKLHDWGVDFACWCTYKYLNSGPGSIGGCFVHEKHADAGDKLVRLAGWWGHRKEDRFDMSHEFVPARGAFGWQLSNPPVLPLTVLRASLDIFHDAGFGNLLRKSEMLTRYLEVMLERVMEKGTYKVITPGYDRRAERGCQLSLVFSAPMERIHPVIEREGVVCDLRKPNVMRIAPCPLYNSFQDVFDFVHILAKAVAGTEGERNAEA